MSRATLLTIDLESDWGGAALRGVDEILPRVLDMFAERNARAVFFVVGSLAQGRGPVIRKLVDDGHVVASHGLTHRALSRCSAAERRDELAASRAILEDTTGRACTGFRAPFFDLPNDGGPLLEECGYRWSSSKAPFSPIALYRHVAARRTHVLSNSSVIEHPVSAVYGLPMPAGLSYVRLFWPLTAAMRAFPRVFYFHPYELLDEVEQFSLPKYLRPFVVARQGRWATERLATLLAEFARVGGQYLLPDERGELHAVV
jgi:hypothetical protein